MVAPGGAKTWRFFYRDGASVAGHTIGRYPTVGLADARRERERREANSFSAVMVAERLEAALLVLIEDLVACLAGDAEPAQAPVIFSRGARLRRVRRPA